MFNVPSLLRFSKLFYSCGYLARKLHSPSQIRYLPQIQFSFKETGRGKKIFPCGALIGSVVAVALCECCQKENCSKCKDSLKPPEPPCKDPPSKCPACGTCFAGKKPIAWEKEDLTHSFLLRQANILTIDSITRVLSETMSAIEDYHAQYRRLIEMLMDLMEDSRCATDTRAELINCKQIVVRSSIEDMKKSILELESYLESVSRLAHASAETAFLANAEYASVALMERLNSIVCQVKDIKDKTLDAERASNELHSLIIVESGRGLK